MDLPTAGDRQYASAEVAPQREQAHRSQEDLQVRSHRTPGQLAFLRARATGEPLGRKLYKMRIAL